MREFPTPEAFLREPNIGVLATVDQRGAPHASPVWYVYDGRTIVVSTFTRSQKFANILVNPKVTLVIDRRTIPYYAVIVRGIAEAGPALTDDELLRMSIHYYGGTVGRQYAERGRGENEVTIRITPHRIIESKAEIGSGG